MHSVPADQSQESDTSHTSADHTCTKLPRVLGARAALAQHLKAAAGGQTRAGLPGGVARSCVLT
jgi:hypothetical protein